MLTQAVYGHVRAVLRGECGAVVQDGRFEADATGEADWNRLAAWLFTRGFEIQDDPDTELDDGTAVYVLKRIGD